MGLADTRSGTTLAIARSPRVASAVGRPRSGPSSAPGRRWRPSMALAGAEVTVLRGQDLAVSPWPVTLGFARKFLAWRSATSLHRSLSVELKSARSWPHRASSAKWQEQPEQPLFAARLRGFPPRKVCAVRLPCASWVRHVRARRLSGNSFQVVDLIGGFQEPAGTMSMPSLLARR